MNMAKLTKEKRKSIARAQKVVDIISKRIKEDNKEKKLDLSNIAKDLADRRERVLEKEE